MIIETCILSGFTDIIQWKSVSLWIEMNVFNVGIQATRLQLSALERQITPASISASTSYRDTADGFLVFWRIIHARLSADFVRTYIKGEDVYRTISVTFNACMLLRRTVWVDVPFLDQLTVIIKSASWDLRVLVFKQTDTRCSSWK